MRILVTVDESAESRQILPTVLNLAQQLKAEVTLFMVCETEVRIMPHQAGYVETVSAVGSGVIFNSPEAVEASRRDSFESPGELVESSEAETLDYLNGLAVPLREAGVAVRTDVSSSDDVADSIVDFAREGAFDFIAMATHGRSGLSELVHGSVSGAVVKSGVAPTILLRPGES